MLSEASDRLQPREFEKLALFIHDYSGIKLASTKMTMVEASLMPL